MKILKYKKLKDNKYSIYLDDDTILKIYDDLIVKYNLLCKKDIDLNELEKINNENDSLAAYYKALKYITIKMRTEKEIKKYLSKDYDSKTINDTVLKIKNEGYINKELYLNCYIEDKVNLSNLGPQRIIKDLVGLGYTEDEVLASLSNYDDIWDDKLVKLIEKKIKSNHGYGENKLKEKIIYDMVNLGYYRKDVEEVLEKIEMPTNYYLLEKEYKKFYLKLSKKYSDEMLEYQLRNKLIYKGFKIDDINNIIEKNRS